MAIRIEDDKEAKKRQERKEKEGNFFPNERKKQDKNCRNFPHFLLHFLSSSLCERKDRRVREKEGEKIVSIPFSHRFLFTLLKLDYLEKNLH